MVRSGQRSSIRNRNCWKPALYFERLLGSAHTPSIPCPCRAAAASSVSRGVCFAVDLLQVFELLKEFPNLAPVVAVTKVRSNDTARETDYSSRILKQGVA